MGRTLLLLALALVTQVTVAQEPSLQLTPTNILKPMGDTIYVACKPNVTDLDLIEQLKWIGPRGEITDDDTDEVDKLGTLDKRPSELGLFVRLTESNVGMYNCTAVYASNQNLNTGIMIKGYMEIDFGDTPEYQTPVINTEGVIRCSVTAKPAPQVDWQKDGHQISSDEHYIILPDGVHISNIQPEDEGVYRCLARVEEIGSFDYKDITVEVYIPPEITTPPSDTKGIEKELVNFKCEASGNPAPEFSWVDKDSRPLNDIEGFYVDKETGMLTIHDLNVKHAGTYRCTATNAVGSDSAIANLRVVTKPRFEELKNITVGVGEKADLDCIFSGDPLPDIKFQKEGNAEEFVDGLNPGDRIQVSQKEENGKQIGNLNIQDVMRSDDGLYMCKGVSEGGKTIAVGHITVEFPPSFEDQPTDEVWTWEQEPVNLTCIVTSIPNATVQWYFRNEEIPADNPQLQVMNLGPVGTLMVTPIDNSYYGVYTCEATNIRGTNTFDITLKEAHAPGPITSATVEKKTATTITWNIVDPVDNGGRLIAGYLVEYKERALTWDSAENHYWVKGSTYLLENLTPKLTYVFRFAARNEVGDGDWSGEKVEEMPHRTVPEEPLLFNMGDGVTEIPYTNSYNLQWSVPLDNGEPIDYFQIIHYPVANVSDKWEMTPGSSTTTRSIEYPGDTHYNIEGLQSNMHYKLELRAHNNIGYSTPAEAIIKTAFGPDPAPLDPDTGGVSVGIIIAVVVVTLFVLAILIDLSCYFTQKAGVTAAIMGKRSSKDKDKEAMLKEVKEVRDNTSKAAVTPKARPTVEKGQPDTSSSSPLPQKQLILCPPNTTSQVPDALYPKNKNKEQQKEVKRAKATIKGKSDMLGRPLSMMVHPEEPYQHMDLKNLSNSMPTMIEASETEDSIYSVPYPEHHTTTEVSGLKRKPPVPPARNPNTQLTKRAPAPPPRAPRSHDGTGHIYYQQTGQPYVGSKETVSITYPAVHYQPQQQWQNGYHNNQNGSLGNLPVNPNISSYGTFYDSTGSLSGSSLSTVYQTDPVHAQTSPKTAFQVAPYLEVYPKQVDASSVKMEHQQPHFTQLQKSSLQQPRLNYPQQHPQQNSSQPQQNYPQPQQNYLQPQQIYPQQQPQQIYPQQQPQQIYPQQQQPQQNYPQQQQPQQNYPQQQQFQSNYPQQLLPHEAVQKQQNSSELAHLQLGGKVLGAGRPSDIGAILSQQKPNMPPPAPPKPRNESSKPKGLKTTTTLYFREHAKGQQEQQTPLSRSLDQLDSDYPSSSSSKTGTSSLLPSSSISSARSVGSLLNPASSSSNSARSFGSPTFL